MHIGPLADDPTASYPAYEIFFDEQTKVEGIKKTIEELKIGDHLEVWVTKKRNR